MDIGYRIPEAIIIIEFILVALIILTTYILKIYYFYKERKKDNLTKDLENYFINRNKLDKDFISDHFPLKWRRLDILLPLVKNLDEAEKDELWSNLRADFMSSIVLPLARKSASSYAWEERFLATEAFGLFSEKADESYIVELIEDKIPLVHLHALRAALFCDSEKAINLCITRMAKMNWLTQTIYLRIFDNVSIETRIIIEKRLEKALEPRIRAACYRILLKYPPVKIKTDVIADIYTDELELRLAAMKFIAYVDKKLAIPYLADQLKDPHWEIRLTALHRLGALKAVSMISKIEACLYDQEWWVKMSAAEVLKSFGKRGEKILKLRAPLLEQIPFDISEHVTNTLW